MSFYIIPVLPFLLLLSSFVNRIDCTHFKTGTFLIESNDGKTYTIVRTKNKQIEKVAETGVVYEFDIKWLTPCRYMLFNSKLKKGVNEFPDMKYDTIYNEITAVTGNTIKVTTLLKRYNYTSEATMRKIK